MNQIFGVDWAGMFSPGTPILEIFIRGTIMYLGIFLILRVIGKRDAGSFSITDLLVIVMLADAAQNGMAGDYKSITDGLLLVLTIIFWSFFLDWLGYHFPVIERIVHPSEILLVDNGKMLHRNLRKELITKDELYSMIREQGVEDLNQVDKVFLEGDGQISVITRENSQNQNKKERKRES